MAYSNDLRLKVLAAVDGGESQAAAARRFGIGERFKQRRALTGGVTADKTGPRDPIKLTPEDDALLREQVRLKPGVTAWELVAMLGGKVVISTVCRRLIALGLCLVALTITLQLIPPEGCLGFRQASAVMATVPMPEATVHEDDGNVQREHQIGRSRKRSRVKPKAKAQAPNQTPHKYFGARVGAANKGHPSAAL